VFRISLRRNSNFALYISSILVFITEVESVYFALRIESLYNTYVSSLKGESVEKTVQIIVCKFLSVTTEAAVITTSVCSLVHWGDSCTLRSMSVSNAFACLVLILLYHENPDSHT